MVSLIIVRPTAAGAGAATAAAYQPPPEKSYPQRDPPWWFSCVDPVTLSGDDVSGMSGWWKFRMRLICPRTVARNYMGTEMGWAMGINTTLAYSLATSSETKKDEGGVSAVQRYPHPIYVAVYQKNRRICPVICIRFRHENRCQDRPKRAVLFFSKKKRRKEWK